LEVIENQGFGRGRAGARVRTNTRHRFPVFGFRYLVSGIWFPVSGFRYLVSGIWFPVSGFRYLESRNGFQVSPWADVGRGGPRWAWEASCGPRWAEVGLGSVLWAEVGRGGPGKRPVGRGGPRWAWEWLDTKKPLYRLNRGVLRRSVGRVTLCECNTCGLCG
jgi:hypothetical protein